MSRNTPTRRLSTSLSTAAIEWGPDRLRISPWRGDATVAHLTPTPGRTPTAAAIDRCVDDLRRRGYRAVLTSALGEAEQPTFLDAGFRVYEELELLQHDLHGLSDGAMHEELGSGGTSGELDASSTRIRRGRRRDSDAVLDLDGLAFDPFWRFDALGLADARSATPTSRFRVAEHERRIAGYAITGRAASIGYLQRLAVHPDAQGRGIGRALVVDALVWARRRGANSVLVNTQAGNRGALLLYQRMGFVREPSGLAVLERCFVRDATPVGHHATTTVSGSRPGELR
jgi:ribosomal protein S18 acetylase RimI-like enzyme